MDVDGLFGLHINVDDDLVARLDSERALGVDFNHITGQFYVLRVTGSALCPDVIDGHTNLVICPGGYVFDIQ